MLFVTVRNARPSQSVTKSKYGRTGYSNRQRQDDCDKWGEKSRPFPLLSAAEASAWRLWVTPIEDSSPSTRDKFHGWWHLLLSPPPPFLLFSFSSSYSESDDIFSFLPAFLLFSFSFSYSESDDIFSFLPPTPSSFSPLLILNHILGKITVWTQHAKICTSTEKSLQKWILSSLVHCLFLAKHEPEDINIHSHLCQVECLTLNVFNFSHC